MLSCLYVHHFCKMNEMSRKYVYSTVLGLLHDVSIISIYVRCYSRKNESQQMMTEILGVIA